MLQNSYNCYHLPVNVNQVKIMKPFQLMCSALKEKISTEGITLYYAMGGIGHMVVMHSERKHLEKYTICFITFQPLSMLEWEFL